MQAFWISQYLAGKALLPKKAKMKRYGKVTEKTPLYLDLIAIACGTYPSFGQRMKMLKELHLGPPSAKVLLQDQVHEVMYYSTSN